MLPAWHPVIEVWHFPSRPERTWIAAGPNGRPEPHLTLDALDGIEVNIAAALAYLSRASHG